MNDLLDPLLLSLGIAAAATVLTCAVGVPLAFTMARTQFRGRSLVEAIITVPLVLPPTVVGYLIVVTLGARGWLGQWLHAWLDYSILFRVEGAILAGATVALPLLYLPAKSAFASVEPELEDIARLFGASRLQTFWHVSLPLARRGIAAGLLLAFARALGEFGATVMVFGWQPGRQTLPILVYAQYEQGDLPAAAAAVAALSGLSFVLILTYNATVAWRD